MTDPLNIIFDDFGIWLLGSKIEFGCLIYSTRALLHKYFVAMKYKWICSFFNSEGKSIFKNNSQTNWLIKI